MISSAGGKGCASRPMSVDKKEFSDRWEMAFGNKDVQKYVIVKYAHKDIYIHYFDKNPIDGVHESHSAHHTYSGKQANIKEFYTDLEEAKADCDKINLANPTGNYEVCKLIN